MGAASLWLRTAGGQEPGRGSWARARLRCPRKMRTATNLPRGFLCSLDELIIVDAFYKQKAHQMIFNVGEGPLREVGRKSKKRELLDHAFSIFPTYLVVMFQGNPCSVAQP